MRNVGAAARVNLWIIALIATLIVAVCVAGKVRGTISDPQGTLLVSQAIIQHGTIELDAYQNYLPRYSYKVHAKNGHFYYYFPLGSSVFSVPFVAVANLFGFDMLDFENELQMAIVAVLSVGTFLLLIAFARLYLSTEKSLFAATAFWFGTAYASTGATGLWSHDFATLFALAAIYLTFSGLLFSGGLPDREQLLRDGPRNERARFIAVGFLLFSAYFCRPTFLLLAALFLPALFIVNRRFALWAACSFCFFLALFSGFSLLEYRQPLPDYYLPARLAGNQFWTALYGNLASPARGFFVYSPFMVLPVLWVFGRAGRKFKFRFEFVFLIWPLLHLCAISRFPHWWAGYSFGARLMFDVLPAFYLWFVLYLRTLTRSDLAQWGLLIAAIIFSVAVNTYQGLFNKSTANWSGQPSIDQFPEYLFDWKYPQFLNSGARQAARVAEHNKRVAASKSGREEGAIE